MVIVGVFFTGGGWSALQKYIRHRILHEKLAAMHYHEEWSLGEYRECKSMNLREEDITPELDCECNWTNLQEFDKTPEFDCVHSSQMDTGKIFNVKFSGDLTYDEGKPEGAVHYWFCRRRDADPSFSCVATQRPSSQYRMTKPAEKPGQLPESEIESLRKRNECEQRFYDKKIYELDGMSVMLACKQNPDRRPKERRPRQLSNWSK